MVLPFVSVLRRRVVMPRGWHQTTSGWWQRSIRGPRLPSEQWLRAGSQQPSQPGRSRTWPNKSGQQQPSPPPLQPATRRSQLLPTPWRVQLRCWGRTTLTRPLLDALRVAKTQATVPPIHDRIKACKASSTVPGNACVVPRQSLPELSNRRRFSMGRLGWREAAPGIVGGGGECSSSRAITKSVGASATD